MSHATQRQSPTRAAGLFTDGAAPMHPLLAKAFRALDDAGISWALLRGADDLSLPSGDTDVLVERAAQHQLDDLLSCAGLCRLGVRGHGSHRFYFAFDSAHDLWIKVDIITEIEFGRFHQFHAPLAAVCLSRRRQVEGIWRLHPADEGWLLLLHLLLDKGEISARRRAEAVSGAAAARTPGPLSDYLDQTFGSGTAQRILDPVESSSTEKATQLAESLSRQWRRHERLSDTTSLTRRVVRRMNIPVPGHPPGLIVAVVGPDGAGKTTLCDALRPRLPVTTELVYAGLWSSSPWDRWLNRLGHGRLVHRLMRSLRSAVTTRYYLRRRRLVLLDRFGQEVALPGSADDSLGGRVLRAFSLAVSPTPGLVIVLDAPGDVMLARKPEHSVQVLEQRRQAYRQLASEYPHSVVIDARQPAHEVTRAAVAAIARRFCRGRTNGGAA